MDQICFNVGFECFDLCFWISTFVIPILTFIVIRTLRPKLKIEALQIKEDEYIKVTASNSSRLFDVNNLRIEICIFSPINNYTYHFEPDHIDFLILPSNSFFGKRSSKKKFVCRKAAGSAMIYLKKEFKSPNMTQEEGFVKLIEKYKGEFKVRVRCHAYHSFSGLGRSFEKVF